MLRRNGRAILIVASALATALLATAAALPAQAARAPRRAEAVTPGRLIAQAAAGDQAAHLFGVSLASISSLSAVRSLAVDLRHPLDVVNIYSGWDSPFPSASVAAIRAAGAIPEITWEPWRNALGVNQNTYPLTTIAAGGFDAYVGGFARAAAASGGPLLLRFAHEMNGNWYPWDVGVNGNTALDYVDAYRHVHAVFAASRASEVYWVWSPNTVTSKSVPLRLVWPGAREVDFVGVDGYNAGVGVPYGWWASPEQVFAKTLAEVETFAPRTPVLITETGSSERGGSKGAWIKEFFAYLAGHPIIAGFVWSEYAGRADWPIETSPASIEAMREGLRSFGP